MSDAGRQLPPEGFSRLYLPGAYTQAAATFYVKPGVNGPIVGTIAEHRHCNSQGFVHGGFLLLLADLALTIGSSEQNDAPPRITLSLSTDFLRAACEGNWLEAHANITKKSSSLIFADAYIYADCKLIVRSSGIFKPVVD